MNNSKKLAVIFPGQSSEHVGMLSNLAIHYKLVKDTFAEASETLGYDIWQLIQNGPIRKLHQTYYAQPAILTASVAIWRIWRSETGRLPSIMAGHSLGEYSALVCANSIDFLSAVKLVMIRGMLMQEASPPGYGAMSVIIGLDEKIILEFCKSVASAYDQIVAPAGFNASNNIVIAGHKEAVYQVNLLCKNEGARYIAVLPISIASHCDLMKSIVNKFQKELDKLIIYPPNISIINNTDVFFQKKPETIRNSLIRQLYTPVRWKEIMQKLSNNNIDVYLEMGPGKVLTRLIRNSITSACSISVNDKKSLSEAMKINYN